MKLRFVRRLPTVQLGNLFVSEETGALFVARNMNTWDGTTHTGWANASIGGEELGRHALDPQMSHREMLESQGHTCTDAFTEVTR